MSKFQLIFKSFLHYFKANLLVAIGVAISTAVLTGGLIIGDSIKHSLELITNYRLGETTFSISAGDRFFRQNLANEMNDDSTLNMAPVLITEAVALADGGTYRANRVQIIGVNDSFERIAQTTIFSDLKRNEIIVNEKLANHLQVDEGDNILFRIKKASLIPMNAPFVSDEEISVSVNMRVKRIANKEELGNFFLKNSQTAPYNVFLSIKRLNELMEFKGKANNLLVAGDSNVDEIYDKLQKHWSPEDANLVYRTINATKEVEVLSERVFLDDRIFSAYNSLPGAKGILTYFVNSFQNKKGKETPYSFVSTLPENQLGANEIVINEWLAVDLGVNTGDTLNVKYYIIGPLRQLKEDSTLFVIKQVVGMNSRYADKTLMPFLPGLTDAGSCSEWETGVPVDLDKIRDKDEDYWDEYKGTPKAFISVRTALELWSNRFGNYTSIRFPENEFDKAKFEETFTKIPPKALGFTVDPVKENGTYAAQNGVDFSQLFIGLSFFLLVAAILLTWLLFLLNLENRYSQIGTLSTLGFSSKQIKSIFISECVFVSAVGSLLGLFLAIAYTELVFNALNSLWYDIVRTNVLEIQLYPSTMLLGFLISIGITILVIYFAIRKKLKQQTADIQKKIDAKEKNWKNKLIWFVGLLTFLLSIIIIVVQIIISDSQNPSLFFLSGGMLLLSILLITGRILRIESKLKSSKISSVGLSLRNTIRNRNRSLSVIILFALGTFLVVTTGANKKDLFSNAQNKSSGTGGYLYFAETTIPVLFNLNDKTKRAEEGMSDDFSVVQFRKVDGDDASCLNLNRISNPAILGVNPEKILGRFSFVAKSSYLDNEYPWQSLNQKYDNEVIPAIVDQTVIQWGLGKKVGDTLTYLNELGDTLKVKMIGGLAPSIFQGYVLISNDNFLKNYPTNSGSSVFLIDGDPEKSKGIAEELQLNFRDYGWESTLTAKRLTEFYSITNTYLSIFLALGALGLALGTIGLAVVLARSILERKNEVALLKAIGFPNIKIFMILSREYVVLLSAGVLIGLVTAVIATLPSLISVNTDVSFQTIGSIVFIILVNGFIWIFLLTALSMRDKKLITSLRNE